jgi:hypothetical protein
LALAPISKLTNACVEIALLGISALIGLLAIQPGMIGLSAGAAAGWWLFAHRARLDSLTKSAPLKAIGGFGLAIVVIAIMHGLAFGVGYAFHTIMRLK